MTVDSFGVFVGVSVAIVAAAAATAAAAGVVLAGGSAHLKLWPPT